MNEIERQFITVRDLLLAEKPKTDKCRQMLNVARVNVGEAMTAFKVYANLTSPDPDIQEMATEMITQYQLPELHDV